MLRKTNSASQSSAAFYFAEREQMSFIKYVDRKNTDCSKWDGLMQTFSKYICAVAIRLLQIQ